MNQHTAIAAPDATLIAAWDRRKAAYATYNALPLTDCPGTSYTPAEQAELDIIDQAEAEILAAKAATPRGVEIQLWIAFSHMLTSRDEDEAATREDIDWFASKGDALDWHDRFMVAAIINLRAMGGAA